MDLLFRSHTYLFFILTTAKAFPPSPPDFLNAFRESLLTIAREDLGDLIDLSAKEVCYDGLVSFGEASTSASNKSCDANSTSLVSCVLTDGLAYANLSLEIFDDCPKIPQHPPALQESRQLHLVIWVPILGVLIIGILIGLAVFAFMKINQKCKVIASFFYTKSINAEIIRMEQLAIFYITC